MFNVFEIRDKAVEGYSNYIRYSLKISDERLKKLVNEEYFDKGIFWPEPLVQLNPNYEFGQSLSELVKKGKIHPECINFFGDIPLFKHQEEAIEIGLKREHFVVSSGTGSGKTLSFLVPIVDWIFHKAVGDNKVCAIIIYPMNALVNSQLETLKVMAERYRESTNQPCPIRFGKYTGQEGSEERQQLKSNPPHILLTNFMMLELMLVRPEDRHLIDEANLQFVVLDELHSYRGRQGADVALLLRRLKVRSRNPNLLFIGTSATLATYKLALRDVVRHCIYGVDKNPLAIELCKVALWIESHAEGKPLAFIDHRIKCGDSLVGVLSINSIENGIPDDAYEPVAGDDKDIARKLKNQNKESKKYKYQYPLELKYDEDLKQIEKTIQTFIEIPDDEPEQIREKDKLYRELQKGHLWWKYKTLCNLWTAPFFAEFNKENEKKIPTSNAIFTCLNSRSATTIRNDISAYAETLALKHRFFHWELEFPEVFAQGGFDVVLGNPPFMGGLKISGTLGAKYRHYLEVTFEPFKGTADLCATFYRRTFSLLKPGGRMGMVATNTIGQGDTRESGLAVIVGKGGKITFAKRFIKWSGDANVEVNLVAIHKPGHSPTAIHYSPILDGQPVKFISSRLDSEPEAEPKCLPQNEGKAFQGDIVRGIGFVIEPKEAEELLIKDPRNADCLFPYLNGEDLNSHPEQKPSRWIICFHDWNLERAKQYPDLLRIVEKRVKPERERLSGPGDKRNRKYWWQFGAYRHEMRRAIAHLKRVLVACIVTEYWPPVFVPNEYVFAHRIVVFAHDDDYHYALLQSTIHEVWARKYSSTLESRLNYSPTDCFDTFPFPPLEYERIAIGEWRIEAMPEAFKWAAIIGKEYHEHRRQIMLNRWIGLTKTYNLFHNPKYNDPDIVRLRELHAEMDKAILACYGWDDIDPQHDFYQNERGQTRFTVSPQTKEEILERLLELNNTLTKEGV